ncbi:hypothetical protein D6779_08060, partial [Candidatus Parcubacteria bacterium]
LEEFLEAGHQIEVIMKLRGRERGNREWALKKLEEFLAMISGEYRKLGKPKFGGMGVSIQITKK